MKIAQVSPLFEAVPPKFYGGTERVVAYLSDKLVELGHDVTVFASADSQTRAKLAPCRDRALRLDGRHPKSDLAAHLLMLDEVRCRADEFDIIHFHVELLPYPFFTDLADKTLTTLHSRLDEIDLRAFYQRWSQFPLVSISDRQREPLPAANWLATVHHGLPLDLYHPPKQPSGDYVAFLGRFSPEKQAEVAIRVAEKTGRNIRLAAKVLACHAEYFCTVIEPALQADHVDYAGEINDDEKSDFLGNAEALLMPVNWPEPFGMVLIEAMACGTPVIAFDQGAIPEVIKHGVTGFVVKTEEEMAEALAHVKELDRARIRREFEARFSDSTMASHYVDLYEGILQRRAHQQVLLDQAITVEPSSNAIPSGVEEGEPRMPYKLFALKHHNTFAVADAFGNIIGTGDGMFRDDTRVLSDYRLVMGDQPLSLLSASISNDNVFFNSHVTNRPLPPLGGRSIPEGVIHIKRSRFLWEERLFERLQLRNYGDEEVSAPLRIHFGADFRDMFEVRGHNRPSRGESLPPEQHANYVVLGYRGLDDEVRRSVISFSETPLKLSGSHADFVVSLPCREVVELYVEIGPDYSAAPCRSRFRLAAARARRSMRNRGRSGGRMHSRERVFNQWLDQSRSDLALLTTELETGPYPYAGIPWFSTPFGRDAIITAMQTLWFDPGLAKGVLSYLAANQADDHSTFRDSAPGKIMHETRKGEMNALKELPFSLYYGGVDTTPLFVMLAGAYAARTGDMEFIDRIWGALNAAMEWIDRFGDSVGDGLLDYASGESTGLLNQGWKDSEDSVFHADGSFPEGPIALVEVQGYKFAALTNMALLCRRRREFEPAKHWLNQAEKVRTKVEEAFWMEDKCFYGLALDGERRLCRVRSSNAGQLLFTGLPSPERAAHVRQQLLSSAFDCGWGIRTLASDEVRYNPMSYHNGSVWPHDTGICAAGMSYYGDRQAAAHILSCLFDSAVHFGMRLPELFCGFQRFPGEIPIAYPVACLPQAWASGSIFMTLQASLGLRVDGLAREIHIKDPQLPTGINHLTINKIPVGEAHVSLTFQRVRERVAVFSDDAAANNVKVLSYL